MATLHVELVTPEREIWTGEADMVVAKTIEGEIGILAGHEPVLGVMVDGSVVRIKPSGDGGEIAAMVSGGFFSVAGNEVSVLAEYAEVAGEIDVDAAREEYERTSTMEGDEAAALRRRAAARLRAAGEEVA